MTEPYFQPVSNITSRIAGLFVLLIGLGAAIAFVAHLVYLCQFVLGIDAERRLNWFNLITFGLFAPPLCVAGYRLLAGHSRDVGSVLPRAWWVTIGVIFVVGAVFVAAVAVYMQVWVNALLMSSLMIGGLGIQSFRIARRRRGKVGHGAL